MIRMMMILLVIHILGSCSTLVSTTYMFRLRMQGTYESSQEPDPDYAAEPVQAKFTFLAVKLLRGADTSLSLYNGDPVEVTIVDRGQRVYEKEITDSIRENSAGSAQTFTGIEVTFDAPWVCVTGEGEVAKSLASPVVTLTSDFTIGKAQDKTFTVNVKWKDIVNSDGSDCKEPELEIVSTTSYD
jgi:hypothetical protein